MKCSGEAAQDALPQVGPAQLGAAVIIPVGTQAQLGFEVGPGDTAAAMGSGDVPVLATPRLIAWAEAATCAAVSGLVPPGRTTVGSAVDVVHLGPSAVGACVQVRAEVVASEGRRVGFEVVASDADGQVLLRGSITRIVVDRAKFAG